jgi:D-tyrosyl-tRNA(Tyr) deacylase
MRVVAQRVSSASVAVNGNVTGAIENGLLILVGVAARDTEDSAEYLVSKLGDLRIFPDQDGRTNLSIRDTGGSFLIVSQFTLFADCRKGRRPGFDSAAPPELAKRLYEHFVRTARASGIPTETGVFQASMSVSLVNEGPFTVLLDSEKVF